MNDVLNKNLLNDVLNVVTYTHAGDALKVIQVLDGGGDAEMRLCRSFGSGQDRAPGLNALRVNTCLRPCHPYRLQKPVWRLF